MGRHASSDRRLRVAAWPVVAAVAVLLVAGLTVGYFVIVNSARKTAACTGNTVLQVIVSPGAARAVGDAAAAFNATAPVARSTCVSVSVDVLPGAVAARALAGDWAGQSTAAPGLWVVDSAADLAALDASNSAMTAGHSTTPLATSPVVLAVRNAPTAELSWASLADRAAGGPVLTLPDPVNNRASGHALESLVAARAGTPSGTAITAAAVTGATPLFLGLASSSPTPPITTLAALTQMADGQGSFTAVPVVESDLATFNATHPTRLSAVYPTGPTAGDQLLAIPLTAPWVTAAVSDAAAAFDAFLGDAKGAAIFAADALRTSTTGPAVGGVQLDKAVTALPAAGVDVRRSMQLAWAAALTSAATTTTPATSEPTPAPTTTPTTTPRTAPTTAAARGPAVTLVLDRSGSMKTVEGNQQRVAWMRSAVTAGIARNPADLFGLWSFSTADGSTGYAKLVALGALTDAVGTKTRAVAITDAVNGLTPSGDSWTYGTIQAAYGEAVGSAVAGRPNRVIVITDGVDSTPGLARATLIAGIAALAAQKKNVVLDIIGLSGDVEAQALTEIAAAGGGTFTRLGTLAALQSTLGALLAG